MKLTLDALNSHLQKPLLPIYLVSGDEPLQLMECTDAIRSAARQQGYGTRDIFEVDNEFDWNSLYASSNSLSLFAEKKLIDLRMPSGKPGTSGKKAICEYADSPPVDTVMLITTGKLDKRASSTAWYKAIDKIGGTLSVWPLEYQQLKFWIQQRLKAKELSASQEAISLIADRVEGNMLAAAQEINKLLLLYGVGDLSDQQVLEAVSDSSRYSVFLLAEAALEGNTVRAFKILEGLRGEGVEPILILWALNREIRSLSEVASQVGSGQPISTALKKANVWGARQAFFRKAINRLDDTLLNNLLNHCGELELAVKGRKETPVWEALASLVMSLSGKPMPLKEI